MLKVRDMHRTLAKSSRPFKPTEAKTKMILLAPRTQSTQRKGIISGPGELGALGARICRSQWRKNSAKMRDFACISTAEELGERTKQPAQAFDFRCDELTVRIGAPGK
jgi:hypothetical protein